MPEMYQIQDVEVFSAGTWNGDTYDVKDLHDMVDAFNLHNQGVRPYLKLGHDDNQQLLQEDGMPAAGWVSNLKVVGEKLVADFCDIPRAIFDLIKQKAYRKVSCEILWNVRIGDMYHKHMLSAVALLGADTPGVMNLKDILGMYRIGKPKLYATSDEFESRTYELVAQHKEGTMPQKSEAEIKLETQLEQANKEKLKLEGDLKEYAAKKEQEEKELSELREYRKSAEAERAKLLAEAEQAKQDQFLSALVQEKLCSPAMKPYALALLGPEKKEYSVKVADKEEKMDKQQLLKEMLKLFSAAKDVNFDENSSAVKTEKKNQQQLLNEKVDKYMADHKVDYKTAVKSVISESHKGDE